MDNTIVVLGNGFDLDLGLKTSYSDFINEYYLNPNEEKKVKTNTLINAILDEYQDTGWVNIEEFLREYAIDLSKRGIPKNRNIKEEYIKLCRDLSSYMYVDKYQIGYKKESCAYYMIPFIVNNKLPIFTLNYTDLSPIIKRIIIDNKYNDSSISYIHGKSMVEWEGRESPIILGIDSVPVKEDFRCMIKSASKYYNPVIISALEQAKDVIFFGVGFGITDAPYFKGFFNMVVNEEFGNKRLFVFTNDDGSDFYYRVSQMIGGDNLPKFREKEIYLYDTSQKGDAFTSFLKDYKSTN